MNPDNTYHIDRELSDVELATLAGDVHKIPAEAKESLEMRFTAAQDWRFYEGFTVAALDVFHHLEHSGEEGLRLRGVQFVAALVLKTAGHLFRSHELPYPLSLRKKLQELPLPARTTIQNLLMDCPCELQEYDTLELTMPIRDRDAIDDYLRLDKSPTYYAGLFHGYYKLHAFLSEVPDVTDEQRADFAMSAAVFLADKLVTHRDAAKSERETTKASAGSHHG